MAFYPGVSIQAQKGIDPEAYCAAAPHEFSVKAGQEPVALAAGFFLSGERGSGADRDLGTREVGAGGPFSFHSLRDKETKTNLKQTLTGC